MVANEWYTYRKIESKGLWLASPRQNCRGGGFVHWVPMEVIGSEAFIRRLVDREADAFQTGHKTPPVGFMGGDTKLKSLRNLSVFRK